MRLSKTLHASGEDYLETILVLQKKRGMVRSVDVARHMDVSKPSVCHAHLLVENKDSLQIVLPGRMKRFAKTHWLYLLLFLVRKIPVRV